MKERHKKIRTPKQDRGIKTKNRILIAAKELFSQHGFHGTNSKEIAKAADVSIGSFYSYFEDKKTCFIEVLKWRRKEVSQLLQQMQDEPLDINDKKGLMTRIVQSILAAHDISSDFIRQGIALQYTDRDIENYFKEENKLLHLTIMNFIEMFKKDITIKDTKSAAYIMEICIEAFAHSLKIFDHGYEEEPLVREFSTMLYKYLFT